MQVERYEKIWIALSVVVLLAFLAVISIGVFAHGISLPGAERRIDPKVLLQEPPFSNPGVKEISPGHYEIYMVAMTWSFAPNEIRLPVGAKATFHITSRDVIHGLYIRGTNVNLMLLPGLVNSATATFDRPGEYLFVCHEYCGLAHHTMGGKVIVEAKP